VPVDTAVSILAAGSGGGALGAASGKGASAGNRAGASRFTLSCEARVSRAASASIVLSRFHIPSATAMEIINAAATRGQ
jgi:hypothetical protein